MFTILKYGAIAVAVLIAFKVFMPSIADEAVGKISESTGIEKSTLDKQLKKASNLAKDKAEELKDQAIDKAKEAINN